VEIPWRQVDGNSGPERHPLHPPPPTRVRPAAAPARSNEVTPRARPRPAPTTRVSVTPLAPTYRPQAAPTPRVHTFRHCRILYIVYRRSSPPPALTRFHKMGAEQADLPLSSIQSTLAKGSSVCLWLAGKVEKSVKWCAASGGMCRYVEHGQGERRA